MKRYEPSLICDASRIGSLTDKKVIIPISVGQKYHENGEWKASVEVYQKLKNVTIVLCDTLQAYNQISYQKEVDIKVVKKECIKDGDAYLDRNKKIMKPCIRSVKRWNDWIEKDSYGECADKIMQLYDARDPIFKEIIDKEVGTRIGTYIKNCKNQKIDPDIACVKENFKNYLFEECAVFLQWAEEKFEVIIYPSDLNRPMAYLKTHYVEDGILESIKIEFQERTVRDKLSCEALAPSLLFKKVPKRYEGRKFSSITITKALREIVDLDVSVEVKMAMLEMIKFTVELCKESVKLQERMETKIGPVNKQPN